MAQSVCIVISTAQAKYIALSHTTKEAFFLRQSFTEFEVTDYSGLVKLLDATC